MLWGISGKFEEKVERPTTPKKKKNAAVRMDSGWVRVEAAPGLKPLSIRLSMFELRETGDWDIFIGLSERARAETVELTNGC